MNRYGSRSTLSVAFFMDCSVKRGLYYVFVLEDVLSFSPHFLFPYLILNNKHFQVCIGYHQFYYYFIFDSSTTILEVSGTIAPTDEFVFSIGSWIIGTFRKTSYMVFLKLKLCKDQFQKEILIDEDKIYHIQYSSMGVLFL